MLACDAAKGTVEARVGKMRTRVVAVFTLKFPARLIFPENFSAEKLSHVVESDNSPEDQFAAENLPKKLKICAIDDCKLICKGYERVLFAKIEADSDASVVVYCKSPEDIESFLNIVTGHETLDNGTAAEIAILDQHLELQGVGWMFMYPGCLLVSIALRCFHVSFLSFSGC